MAFEGGRERSEGAGRAAWGHRRAPLAPRAEPARHWRHRRRLLSGRQEWKAREVLFRAGVGVSRAFKFASPGSPLSPSGWLWGGGPGCVAFRECERWGSVVARSPTSAFLWLLAGFGLPWRFTSLGPAFSLFPRFLAPPLKYWGAEKLRARDFTVNFQLPSNLVEGGRPKWQM